MNLDIACECARQANRDADLRIVIERVNDRPAIDKISSSVGGCQKIGPTGFEQKSARFDSPGMITRAGAHEKAAACERAVIQGAVAQKHGRPWAKSAL